MEQSFLDFKAQNPEWEPDANTGAGYLSTVLSHKNERSNLIDDSMHTGNVRRV